MAARGRHARGRRAIGLAAAGVAIALSGIFAAPTRAGDVSAPVILQYFEGSYATIEKRMADIFAAGYGSVYLPPPGRAESGDQSVGYDQYDRFDLGSPGRPTLYGTETGLKAMVGAMHQIGGSAYVDVVWNHSGFADMGTAGFAASGGYPGLALTLQTSDPNAPGYNQQGINDIDGDYHGAFEGGDWNMRLAGLIDINQDKQYYFIRSPVDPNDPRNLPAGTVPWNGKLANVPDPANARFYPDRTQQPIMVYDPTTGEHDIPIYPFNPSNPAGGEATPETSTGYLMRNTQWMVQTIGIDGFRIDAAKNMPPGILNAFDRSVYRASTRTLLNGQQQQVFSFSEAYDGNYGLLDQYVKKNIDPNDPGTIGGNRDVLDFPLYFALRDNLTGNGYQNDWRNIVGNPFDMNNQPPRSYDYHDNGKLDGSGGVKFVSNQDNFAPQLGTVAYAYTLMTPGNSVVYFNAHEFGIERDFPKDGRGDALGGTYGDAISTLVDLRNRYGRGNYLPQYISKESFAFEREGSALVLLSNRLDNFYDNQTINVSFPYGTYLVEQTGNAAQYGAPQVLTVTNDSYNGPSKVNVSFLPNNGGDHGYLVYGLPTPQGSVSLTGVSQVLAGHTPDGQTSANLVHDNAVTRLSDINVVTGNSFQVKLDTVAVKLLGLDSLRDHYADGDNALLRLDGGRDVNGNGYVDFTNPDSVQYGYEQFTEVHNPGYFANNGAGGAGQFVQTINTTGLSEGMHYIQVLAFRHRDDGGPAVYTDWHESIYVDRLPPISAVDSTHIVIDNGVSHPERRDFWIKSVDQTADSVHVFLDLPEAVGNQQILSMVGGGNQSQMIDRDLFKQYFGDLTKGNHVLTVVTYEITGNYNIQRFAGINTSDSPIGAAMGDILGQFQSTPDGYLEGNDVLALYDAIKSNGNQFYAAADYNGDGRMTFADWTALGMELDQLLGSGMTNPGGGALVSQGTVDYYRGLTSSVPEPAMFWVLGLSGLLLIRRGKETGRGEVSGDKSPA